MVMELSMNGSLDSYLRSSKPADLSGIPNQRAYKTAGRSLNTQALLKFCLEIAIAMEHLGTKKVMRSRRNITCLVALSKLW